MKCKGCTGEIFYVPLAEVNEEDRSHAGAALRHVPPSWCEWFKVTPASQIIAYIKVARFKVDNERQQHNLFDTSIPS